MKLFWSKLPLHYKGLILISSAAFLWSTSGLFIKILKLDALQISFYRSLFAGLTIYILTSLHKRSFRVPVPNIISVLSSFSYAGILIFFVLANKLTTSANAIFLQFTAPVYLLFLEPLFLKTKFQFRNIITVIVTLLGMTLFFFGKLEIGSVIGNLLAITAGICFAFFSLFNKWNKVIDKSEQSIYSVIFGNYLVVIIAGIFVFDKLNITPQEFLIVLYMGVVQIGISYIIFNIGLNYVSATESMIIGMLEAIFNPIWVFIGLGEVPSVYAIIGGAIVLSAILIHNLLKRSE
ncbi:MAG: DMT family transporter [Ignavibacteria bacterium]